jgi:uroporphyrinogen decarboxylase
LIDVSQVTDDLGSQAGPLMSLDLYREFYAPLHRRMIDLCHESGILVMHHDDGSCRAFLPLLVDMGIDLQPSGHHPAAEYPYALRRSLAVRAAVGSNR